MRDPVAKTKPRHASDGIEPYAERRKKAAAATAKRQSVEALVEQVRACLEYDVRMGLFEEPSERLVAVIGRDLHEGAIRWVENVQEQRDLICEGQDPREVGSNLMLEYILSALRVANEDGQYWNNLARTWLERLDAEGMSSETKHYLTRFLSSFQKAMHKRSQRKWSVTTQRNGVITEMVELVAQYSGLERRRASSTYVTPERERTRDEAGCSIVQLALTKLEVEMAESNVRDIFDDNESEYAVPLRRWLSRHRKNLTLSEAYERYRPGPTLVPASLVEGLSSRQVLALLTKLHPHAGYFYIVPDPDSEVPAPPTRMLTRRGARP
jgi:hypothetical protein